MNTRQLFCAALALTGVVVGCRPNQPSGSAVSPKGPVAQAPSAGPSTAPAATQPVTADRPIITDAPRSTADTLAQRANTYAQNIEPLLNRRNRPATQPDASTAVADASDKVEWLDPKSPPAQEERQVHVATPAKESGPTISNHGASIAPPAARDTSAQPRTEEAKTAKPPEHAEPAKPPMEVASANVGIHVPQASVAEATADDLTRRLSQHVKDYPHDVAGQLDYQLLQFARGDSVPNLKDLAGLPSEDRELLSALMDGLSNFRSAVRADSNMLLSKKVRPLLEMSDRIRSQAELSIPTLALCKRVDAFGVYTPMEPARFTAGAKNEAIIYCEVENFASQLNSQKMWETRLRMDVVLYEDQGLDVWNPDKPTGPNQATARPVADLSRNRRHDFFLGRKILLPPTLGVGRYILKVTVVDMEVNRIAENTIPLEIVAQ